MNMKHMLSYSLRWKFDGVIGRSREDVFRVIHPIVEFPVYVLSQDIFYHKHEGNGVGQFFLVFHLYMHAILFVAEGQCHLACLHLARGINDIRLDDDIQEDAF